MGSFIQAAKESPFIARALDTLRKISGNDEMRMEADARERALNDMADYYNDGLCVGEARGIKVGEARGADNERRRMALPIFLADVMQRMQADWISQT